jgi:cathepsin L
MMFKENDESGVKGALSKSGPVSVCVDASNWAPYRSGVFSNCGKTNLNHAVTAVGYQADGVWIVRNSWGASWGDSGHIRLATGNTCGILAHAVVPNLA